MNEGYLKGKTLSKKRLYISADIEGVAAVDVGAMLIGHHSGASNMWAYFTRRYDL